MFFAISHVFFFGMMKRFSKVVKLLPGMRETFPRMPKRVVVMVCEVLLIVCGAENAVV